MFLIKFPQAWYFYNCQWHSPPIFITTAGFPSPAGWLQPFNFIKRNPIRELIPSVALCRGAILTEWLLVLCHAFKKVHHPWAEPAYPRRVSEGGPEPIPAAAERHTGRRTTPPRDSPLKASHGQWVASRPTPTRLPPRRSGDGGAESLWRDWRDEHTQNCRGTTSS